MVVAHKVAQAIQPLLEQAVLEVVEMVAFLLVRQLSQLLEHQILAVVEVAMEGKFKAVAVVLVL